MKVFQILYKYFNMYLCINTPFFIIIKMGIEISKINEFSKLTNPTAFILV